MAEMAAPFCPQCGARVQFHDSNYCGVCGAALLRITPPAPAGAPAATSWDVELTRCGSSKIAVIKIVREATGLGLRESKELVDSCPSLVVRGRERANADQLVSQLRAAGADARVLPG